MTLVWALALLACSAVGVRVGVSAVGVQVWGWGLLIVLAYCLGFHDFGQFCGRLSAFSRSDAPSYLQRMTCSMSVSCLEMLVRVGCPGVLSCVRGIFSERLLPRGNTFSLIFVFAYYPQAIFVVDFFCFFFFLLFVQTSSVCRCCL